MAKIWIQIDEEELEYLEDAGLTVTQVKPGAGTRLMRHDQAYRVAELCRSPRDQALFAESEAERVRKFWYHGLVSLSRAVIEETGWKPQAVRFAERSERDLYSFTLDDLLSGSLKGKTVRISMEQMSKMAAASTESFANLLNTLRMAEGMEVDPATNTVQFKPGSKAAEMMQAAIQRKRDREQGYTGALRPRPLTNIDPKNFRATGL